MQRSAVVAMTMGYEGACTALIRHNIEPMMVRM